MRTWGLVVVAALMVIALTAAVTVAVVQTRRLGTAREEAAALEARVTELEEALEDAGPDPDTDGTPGGGSAAPDSLEDLLGGLEDALGGEGGGLADLLEGLGDLGDLDAAQALLRCAQPVEGVERITATTLEGQIEQVRRAVETIRGVSFPEPLEPVLLDADQLAERLEQSVAETVDPDDVDADRRMLSALRAVPADIDLVATQLELLSAQVAGFYDTDTRELVVRADAADQPLGFLELIALAHEMEHALADATVGLPDLDAIEDDEDRLIAHLGAVEGDAVLLQTLFQVSATDPLDQLAQLANPDLLASQAALDAVPAYLASSLVWPYEAGPAFVCDAFADGGWAAVDELLATPPATSVEVLHPELRQPGATPADLADPPAPDGYEPAAARTFGAAQLSWLLAAPGDDPAQALDDVDELTDEWAAGEIHLFTRGADSAVAVTFADRPGGESLCDVLAELYRRAVPDGAPVPAQAGEELAWEGGGQVGVVACDGDLARLAIGPDAATARALTG